MPIWQHWQLPRSSIQARAIFRAFPNRFYRGKAPMKVTNVMNVLNPMPTSQFMKYILLPEIQNSQFLCGENIYECVPVKIGQIGQNLICMEVKMSFINIVAMENINLIWQCVPNHFFWNHYVLNIHFSLQGQFDWGKIQYFCLHLESYKDSDTSKSYFTSHLM